MQLIANRRCVIGAWLLFALIMTEAFGGSLRAYLLQPDYSEAINSFEDIVGSGLPWKMVVYGEEFEHFLASQEQEPFKTFWQEKQEIEYSEYPIDTVRQINDLKEVYYMYVYSIFRIFCS